jgi:hypothetical protein
MEDAGRPVAEPDRPMEPPGRPDGQAGLPEPASPVRTAPHAHREPASQRSAAPVMARAITSRWISLVPSKMV